MSTEITRSWLSLLRSANHIKKTIDARLKAEFSQSISRFDVMAALYRHKSGPLRAGELSRQLFVSDGNTTQLMTRLLRDKLVSRKTDTQDARVVLYKLTSKGTRLFERMAKEHNRWLENLFEGMSAAQVRQMHKLLQQLPPGNRHSTKESA